MLTASLVSHDCLAAMLPADLCIAGTQIYRGVIEGFKTASRLPEEAILDVRGNHDSFDTILR